MTPITIQVNHCSEIPLPCRPHHWIKKALGILEIHSGMFEFTFVDNAQIIQINKDYLKRDYATDIISFNLGSPQNIVGDIYISLEKVQENAGLQNHSFKKELVTVLVHGILHLLDYQDYTEEEKAHMHQKQDQIVKQMGL
jgi:probable rRNA maturation factor